MDLARIEYEVLYRENDSIKEDYPEEAVGTPSAFYVVEDDRLPKGERTIGVIVTLDGVTFEEFEQYRLKFGTTVAYGKL